ncbi:hypothetical protein ACLOJK_008396 [Asimina triloba]
MSGVSLAVAPRSYPCPPNPETTPERNQSQNTQKAQSYQQPVGGVTGSLRVIELQLVAFVMVFSAIGLVPIIDLAFPAFASAYFLILSRFVFPSHSKSSSSSSSSTAEIFQGRRLFRLYVAVGTSIGLFLPLAYVLGGFARGDDHAVRSATPHLFLLSFQILTENVINGLSLFSPPVRALVPLLYTVRRIFVIVDWIADVWLNKTIPPNAEFKVVSRLNSFLPFLI